MDAGEVNHASSRRVGRSRLLAFDNSAAAAAVVVGSVEVIGGRVGLPGGQRLRPAHLKYKLNI